MELVFGIIGTIAFAVSGAALGIRKEMDIFGISFLGLTTGVGGGIIRDLIIGYTPPMAFRDPTYLLIAIAVSIIVFLPPIRNVIFSRAALYENTMLLMDTIGLAVFTVSGIESAYLTANVQGIILPAFVGVVTGVGGGVLRDIMAGDRPYIFVKDIYASASLAGAFACVLLWEPLGQAAAMGIGAGVTLVIRLLAAKFHWHLPKVRQEELPGGAEGAPEETR